MFQFQFQEAGGCDGFGSNEGCNSDVYVRNQFLKTVMEAVKKTVLMQQRLKLIM